METKLRPTLILLAAGALSGCSAPTVNLATNEPIKVDINMRLDVYQYNASGTATPKPGVRIAPDDSPESRSRNREADIQVFKKNQLVGENRHGLVSTRPAINEEKPEYREYIRSTVESENAERMNVMKTQAEAQKISLPDIQSKQAELWRNRAFQGEWIEIPDAEGRTGTWQQKGE